MVRRERDCRTLPLEIRSWTRQWTRSGGCVFPDSGPSELAARDDRFVQLRHRRKGARCTTVSRPESKRTRPTPPVCPGFGNVTASSRGLRPVPRLLPAGPALRSRRVDRVTSGTERLCFRSCGRTGGGVVRTFRIDADSRWGNGHRHCLCRHRSKRSSLVASSLGGNPERRIPHSWSIAKPSIALQWGASDSPAAAGQGRTRR